MRASQDRYFGGNVASNDSTHGRGKGTGAKGGHASQMCYAGGKEGKNPSTHGRSSGDGGGVNASAPNITQPVHHAKAKC